uniref:Glycosyltransferase n=1 Tax=viral metagenome TaxID=1070528 RepID=A0A6C0EZW0_9ZZZZ
MTIFRKSNIKSRSSRTKKTSSKSSRKSSTLYCCPDRKNKTKCSKITKELNININKKDKYAIMSLIFGGDAYLPGILLLGSSIRKVMPANISNIDLCCMVTKDVSPDARDLILKIYDRVIEVEYIQIPSKLIKHKNPNTQQSYSKTFTKLRIFEFTEYDKILFLDADMLVLKKDFFSLFNLRTPAAIFMGKLSNNPKDRYFKEFTEKGRLFKQFQNKYCNWKGKGNELHGELIPYDNKYENERSSDGMNIETSVLLIKPSKYMASEVAKYIENIKQKNIRMAGDTEMISRMFKDKMYAIEPRFFGRWVNPDEHPELVVLDLYGSDGKPWDIAMFKELLKYIDVGDVSYWWKMYMKMYEKEYKKYNSNMLDKLYEIIGKVV